MHEAVLKICREVNSEIPEVYSDDLISGGYIDSFGVFMIMASIEIELDIKIPKNELCYDNFKSIDSIVELIDKIKRGVINA